MPESVGNNDETALGRWLSAAIVAVPVTILLLGFITYWFAFADRYTVFLYFHDMGPLVPDTGPFSAETSSRYWMAGLVASGLVMVPYAVTVWLLGRFARDYHPPAFWRIWLVAVPLLIVAIPVITMNANDPVLRPLNAAQVTLVTVSSLALALAPTEIVARSPVKGGWLFTAGMALGPVLLFASKIDQIEVWLDRGRPINAIVLVAGLAFGLLALLVVCGLYVMVHNAVFGNVELLVAGACVAYLFMPVVHHLGFTDGYFYISSASNFFAGSLATQLMAWFLAAVVALTVLYGCRYLAKRHDIQ